MIKLNVFIYKFRYDIILLAIFIIACALIEYCYPVAQFSWDGNYYVEHSIKLVPDIRPIGYPFFLKILYKISPKLPFVVYSQFFIYFLSIYLFLLVLRKLFDVKNIAFFSLGVLLLIEPVALYACFNILSDLLFTCLSILYFTSLLLYLRDQKRFFFFIHLILLFFCLEVRLLALFYPFFSILILMLFLKSRKIIFINSLLLFATFFADHELNIRANYMQYGIPIHSAFSGWTQANNAMYALPYIRDNGNKIKDPEIRKLYSFFKKYLDTTIFFANPASSDWMWDARSPMNIIRQKVEDSLGSLNINDQRYIKSLYILAPLYSKYGNYVETHYPFAYFKGFILPNAQTLMTPHDGEMSDYYVGPPTNQDVLDRYRITQHMIFCRKQIYKNILNKFDLFCYRARLLLFLLSIAIFIYYMRITDVNTQMLLVVSGIFISLFFSMMLYSSRFMPRYVLPILPLMTTFIFISIFNFIEINFKKRTLS